MIVLPRYSILETPNDVSLNARLVGLPTISRSAVSRIGGVSIGRDIRIHMAPPFGGELQPQGKRHSPYMEHEIFRVRPHYGIS